MLTSMTGFGSASAERNGLACVVEIRSVNNRFFKSTIKLPDKLAALETDLEKVLRDSLGRGSIVCTVALKATAGVASVTVNQQLLDTYLDLARATQRKLESNAASIDIANLLNLPGVIEAGDSTDFLAENRDLVLQLTRDAIARLTEMRQQEGAALWSDLAKHLELIRSALGKITTLAPNVARNYHEKLRARVQQMVADAKLSLSDTDLLKEVALFADRADISEEISRLAGHLDQFKAVCEAEDQAGRKLDFIAQEMLREANTIASKANDSAISRLTVDIKSCIDRIKEQVQNAE